MRLQDRLSRPSLISGFFKAIESGFFFTPGIYSRILAPIIECQIGAIQQDFHRIFFGRFNLGPNPRKDHADSPRCPQDLIGSTSRGLKSDDT